MSAELIKIFNWPARRLREGYFLRDLPWLALARARRLSPHFSENELNERETVAQAEKVRSTPRMLFLEITGRCPVRCLMCARRYRDWTYGDMEEAVFERLLPVFGRIGVVVLGGFGEPLVARDFDHRFSRLMEMKAKVAIQTSGYQLTEERAKQLVAGGLHHLHISMDAPEPAIYRSIRPGVSFDEVQARIRQIVQLKREAKQDQPTVQIVFVAMRRNIELLPEMVDLAHDLGADMLTVQYLVAHDEQVRGESLFYHQQLANRMFEQAEERARRLDLKLELPQRFGQTADSDASHCRDPWQVMFVRWNGEVQPCCYGSGAIMGDLRKQTFWEIWNGEKYRELRRRVNKDNPPDYCRICTAGRKRGVEDERAHVLISRKQGLGIEA